MTGDNRYVKILEDEKERRIMTMCDVAEYMENIGMAKGIAQGIAQGIDQGISQGMIQGRERERSDNIERLAQYFMDNDASLTKTDAIEMAKNILK